MNDSNNPSKSARKREMTALQDLAIAISKLSAQQFAQIPLPESLKKAIIEYQKLTTHGALRRQAQFLGKLMRAIDVEPIMAAYEKIHKQHQFDSRQFHQAENWRERLLQEGKPAIQAFLNNYLTADLKTLTDLVDKAQQQQAQSLQTKYRKALFRYLIQQISA